MIGKERITNRKIKYKIIYFIYIIILPSIIIISLCKYTTYTNLTGVIQDKSLLISCPIKDINTIIDNNQVKISKKKYPYQILQISDIYVDNNLNNYQDIVLDIKLEEKYLVNNYIINIQIEKQQKLIINYVMDYLKGKGSSK